MEEKIPDTLRFTLAVLEIKWIYTFNHLNIYQNEKAEIEVI
jgi:hypothetical protein